jgi:hypothetical protein
MDAEIWGPVAQQITYSIALRDFTRGDHAYHVQFEAPEVGPWPIVARLSGDLGPGAATTDIEPVQIWLHYGQPETWWPRCQNSKCSAGSSQRT